jgi:tetratricopeptide (TPR) repeat protein
MNRRDDDDDFSWDKPRSGSSFFQGIKSSLQRWQFERKLASAERKAMDSFLKEQKAKTVDPERQSSSVSSNRNSSGFESSAADGRFVKQGEQFGPQKLTFLQKLKQDRELRREILAERRSSDAALETRSVATPNRVSKSEFGVGGDSQAYGDNLGGPPVKSVNSILKALVQKLVKARIPQWAMATLPAIVIFNWAIIPGVTNSEDRYAATSTKLQTKLPAFVEAGQWKEADLTAHRILGSNLSKIDDVFAYYETLKGMKEPIKAWNFLVSQEETLKELDRGNYFFRFAEKILNMQNLNPTLINQAVAKLTEALKNPLLPANEIKARQFLSRIIASRGDLETAYKILEPVQSQNVVIASEVLWLKWNLSESNVILNIQGNARRLLDELDRQIAKSESIDDTMIGCRSRLLMMMDQEPALRGWIAALPKLGNEEKVRWSKEIDQLSLAAEIKRKPIREDYVWQKLLPLIELDANNMLWGRIATTLWASPKSDKNAEAFQWVQKHIESGKASADFMRQASMSAHMQARWDLARPIYRKIVEQNPDDMASTNNLAGVLYKFPPYEYEEALKLIDKVVAKMPDNLGILETKGQILARMGRLDESKVILEKCLPLLPNEWNLHNTLAQIYEIEGQKSRAQAHRDRLASLRKPSNAPLVESIRGGAGSAR